MRRLRAYRQDDLPALVDCWNRAFAGGPNFTTLTEKDFLDRVDRQPSFDPEGLLMAVDGERAAGFVHFGPFTNSWYSLPERRAGPEEGQVWALVAPGSDRPLMEALLEAALERLSKAGASRVFFYPSWVQCTQPFYNCIAGAYEMPGLSSGRVELLALLAENGFEPIADYATPELDLLDRAHLSKLREESARIRQRMEGTGIRPQLREVTSAFFPPRRVIELVWGLETIAMTAFGPWEEYAREYKRQLYGITGVQVTRAWRGMGLGRLIMILAMEAAIKEGAEGLHLHVYQDNRPAWNLYHRALGFQPKFTWLTLAKQL